MKVKKVIKKCKNTPVIIRFVTYDVPYTAGKLVQDEDILNSKVLYLGVKTLNDKPHMIICINEHACNFESIPVPEAPKEPKRFRY